MEKDTFFEIAEDGEIQEINITSGEVVQKCKSLAEIKIDNLRDITGNLMSSAKRVYRYSPQFAEIICQNIADGKSLTATLKMPGFPKAGIIGQWKAAHPEFAEALEMAKKMRAEIAHDMILDSIKTEGILDKDSVPGAKHKLDKLKYIAEKNDPDTYGQKTKISGDKNAPLQIVVDTGIRRSPEPKDE
jgi:hypothetical protein